MIQFYNFELFVWVAVYIKSNFIYKSKFINFKKLNEEKIIVYNPFVSHDGAI